MFVTDENEWLCCAWFLVSFFSSFSFCFLKKDYGFHSLTVKLSEEVCMSHATSGCACLCYLHGECIPVMKRGFSTRIPAIILIFLTCIYSHLSNKCITASLCQACSFCDFWRITTFLISCPYLKHFTYHKLLELERKQW